MAKYTTDLVTELVGLANIELMQDTRDGGQVMVRQNCSALPSFTLEDASRYQAVTIGSCIERSS